VKKIESRIEIVYGLEMDKGFNLSNSPLAKNQKSVFLTNDYSLFC